jgi:putative ABC transport system permease protein
MNVKSPQDMLGKEITLEYNSSPAYYELGKKVDTTANSAQSVKVDINPNNKEKLKIVSVIDDRNDSSFAGVDAFINQDYAYKAITLANSDITKDKTGFIGWDIVVDDYNNLSAVIEGLKGEKYLPFSTTQLLIDGVKTAFNALTVVLGLFGLIALIASIFGIVNVMTISVLERKKEIGILKSLGARDGDIFRIFLFESSVLGLLGWLWGTLLALACGWGIASIFKLILANNQEWRDNLQNLNIENFNPAFPWYLLVGTLLLAVFFTTVSGLVPAIRAGKQNPVEVLRSE